MEFKNEIIDKVANAIAEALMDGAEEIAEESRAQVPKKSGALQENCKVEALGKMNVTVGYDLPYAVVVHEDLQSRHESGKAKYLEDPFNQKAENIIEDVTENIVLIID